MRSLKVQVFGDNHHIDLPTLRLNHPLKRFTFVDSYGVVSPGDMALLLSYVFSVEYIHLTLSEIPFTRLASILNQHLHRLKIFDCYIQA